MGVLEKHDLTGSSFLCYNEFNKYRRRRKEMGLVLARHEDNKTFLREVEASEKTRRMKVYRGEIWMADLGYENVKESEQRGYRPVLVIQNDIGNRFSPTVIVACITKQHKTDLPTHMKCELFEPSTIMFEQIRTISKERLNKRVTTLTDIEMKEVNERIKISMGIE